MNFYLFCHSKAEVFAIKIEGTTIETVELTYRTTDNKKVKLNDKALPSDGLITFNPPVLMASFEIKIKSLEDVATGFRFNILACAENFTRPVYDHTETTTPFPTYPSELCSIALWIFLHQLNM